MVHHIAEPWAQRKALLLMRSDKEPTAAEATFIEALLQFRYEEAVAE